MYTTKWSNGGIGGGVEAGKNMQKYVHIMCERDRASTEFYHRVFKLPLNRLAYITFILCDDKSCGDRISIISGIDDNFHGCVDVMFMISLKRLCLLIGDITHLRR